MIILFIKILIIYVIFFTLLDHFRNKFHKNIWKKIKRKKKIKIIKYNLLHNFIFFITFFTGPYSIYMYKDMFSESCNNYNCFQILIIFFHLIILVYTLYGWISNNNKCGLTIIQNEQLGIDKDYAYRDFYSVIFNKYYKVDDSKLRDDIYYLSLFINIAINIVIIKKLIRKY